MQLIQAWKTTDGKVFEAKDDAGSHQYELDLKAAIREVCNKHCFSGMSQQDVESMLWEERFTLAEVFSNGLKED